jgi:hypothetical protein
VFDINNIALFCQLQPFCRCDLSCEQTWAEQDNLALAVEATMVTNHVTSLFEKQLQPSKHS